MKKTWKAINDAADADRADVTTPVPLSTRLILSHKQRQKMATRLLCNLKKKNLSWFF